MRIRVLVISIITLVGITLGTLAFFLINSNNSIKKISLWSYDNKEEFVLYEGKVKEYGYNERAKSVRFCVDNKQSFIEEYILRNEAFTKKYSYFEGDSTQNDIYEFIYKSHSFIVWCDNISEGFLLQNSTVLIDATFGNNYAIFPENLLIDLPNDVESVSIDYDRVRTSIGNFADLVSWYESINCPTVKINSEKTEIAIDIYSVPRGEKNEEYQLIITSDSSMIIRKNTNN